MTGDDEDKDDRSPPAPPETLPADSPPESAGGDDPADSDAAPAAPAPAEDRTVFSPLPASLTGGASTPPGTSDPADAGAAPPPPPPSPPLPSSAQTVFGDPNGTGSLPSSGAPLRAPGESRHVRVGDVLNHIFEVRRFIARGGMGEVFEGINVNTDERVAIKVILPHLAADPAVQAMFRKEARTLTRLSHPGLVQYRVLAQEPQLGALYIVTEFIDGKNLSDELGHFEVTAPRLVGLLRKLAEGLRAAHALGAVHRDLSPDNVMLGDGRLENAKVIDFGIAKDLDPAGQTIVGDGFAGKLNYVAPEQLGDYGREIGAWSDVYSLGLTILAVALGRDVNMGATLVEAVDRRRAGVDVSDAPEELRPVLSAMLQADPANRLRSMDEVLQMIDSTGLATATGFQPQNTSFGPAPGQPAKAGPSPKVLALAGAGALALAALAFALWPSGGDGGGGTVKGGAEEVVLGPPPADPVAASRTAVEGQLGAIPCSWLEINKLEAEGTSADIALRGVSGKSAEALDRLERALKVAGIQAASMDFSEVSPIPVNFCRAVEAFNQIRAQGPGRFAVKQRKFEMGVLPPRAGSDAGKLGAEAVFTLDLKDFDQDITLIGLDETGNMQQLPINEDVIKNNFEALGNDSYRFTLNVTHSGWSGMLLLTGTGPFEGELLTHPSGTLSNDWTEKFESVATERGWKAEMVWYKTVDEVAN